MKTKANEIVHKLFNITVKSVDDEKRTASFVFSDDSIDRYNEKVDQSWDVKNYEKNPVILWGHDPSKAENVIGSAIELTLNDNGKSMLTAQFDDDPHSQLIFNKIKKGILRTVSAGFIPHDVDIIDGVPHLKNNELLEVSVVAIPANPNAVALDFKAGGMSRKDADFLIKSMREEADALEAQTKSADDPTTEELAAKVAELETQLAEANHRADELTTENDELKAANPDDDDSAKGGDDDQPGAEDDIDLDAELSEDDIDALEVADDEQTNE